MQERVDWNEVINKIEEHWNEDFSFREALVALYRVGSHSHGTHIPPSDPTGIDDTDFMAVVIPPMNRVCGLRKFEGAQWQKDGLDVVVYEWGKHISLLLKSNPNVIGTLWLEGEDVYPSFLSHLLYENRDIFSSLRLYPAFMGYAQAQLHKMTHHASQGYMGEKRKRLVAQFGYDVKNAAHLIRLLRMGTEFLETGRMQVRRPDAEELMEIKRGEWSLEEVVAESAALHARAAQAKETSSLPENPMVLDIEDWMLYGYQWKWEQMDGDVWPQATER